MFIPIPFRQCPGCAYGRRAAARAQGQVQKKLARMESRTRTSATCLASVALPAHQARWKAEITELQRELDEAEDMESEMLSLGSDVPPSLAARLKRLMKKVLREDAGADVLCGIPCSAHISG